MTERALSLSEEFHKEPINISIGQPFYLPDNLNYLPSNKEYLSTLPESPNDLATLVDVVQFSVNSSFIEGDIYLLRANESIVETGTVVLMPRGATGSYFLDFTLTISKEQNTDEFRTPSLHINDGVETFTTEFEATPDRPEQSWSEYVSGPVWQQGDREALVLYRPYDLTQLSFTLRPAENVDW